MNHDASFLRFDTIPECDGRRDRGTDGHLCSGYTSACIACYANALVKTEPWTSAVYRWLRSCPLDLVKLLSWTRHSCSSQLSVFVFKYHSNPCHRRWQSEWLLNSFSLCVNFDDIRLTVDHEPTYFTIYYIGLMFDKLNGKSFKAQRQKLFSMHCFHFKAFITFIKAHLWQSCPTDVLDYAMNSYTTLGSFDVSSVTQRWGEAYGSG